MRRAIPARKPDIALQHVLLEAVLQKIYNKISPSNRIKPEPLKAAAAPEQQALRHLRSRRVREGGCGYPPCKSYVSKIITYSLDNYLNIMYVKLQLFIKLYNPIYTQESYKIKGD